MYQQHADTKVQVALRLVLDQQELMDLQILLADEVGCQGRPISVAIVA